MNVAGASAAGQNLARYLQNAASAPYRPAGRLAYGFARGKLAHDPVFEAILSRGLLTGCAHILDLGCGQGLLAAWLLAARNTSGTSKWPNGWPSPPQPAIVRGIDLEERYVERARLALGHNAEFVQGDLRTADFGRADGIVVLDVLHYIEYADQRSILERIHRALIADGVLLLRVGDAGGGFGFNIAKWVDWMVLLACGLGLQHLHCRSTAEWRDLLFAVGFHSEAIPMSAGTPFANVLIVAKPR